MSTSYFPETNIQPVQQPDIVGQMGKVIALRNAMQQMQYQQQMQPLEVSVEQQKVQDVTAGQQAYQEWNGKSYNDLASLIVKHGGSLAAANQVAMYGLNQQKTLADIYKSNNEGAKAQVEATAKNHDITAGAINAVTDNPDDKLAQATLDTSQRLFQDKTINQQMYATAQQWAQQTQQGQMTPAELRWNLTNFAKNLTAESEQAQNAQRLATAAYLAPQAALKGAEAKSWEQFHAANPAASYDDYLAQLKATQAGAEAQARLPVEMSLAAFNRQTALGNTLLEHGMNQINNLFTGPQGYSQTLSVLGAAKDRVAAAQNGDQLAASLAPLMTALGVTSYAGIHRVNQNEINAAGPQVGSIFRQINAALDKAGTGKLAPATAQEMSGLMDTLLTARHNTVVQSARMAAANAGIDPSRVAVMDRQGNLTPLSALPAAPAAGAAPGAGPAPGGHTIRIGNKFYQYNGSGDTSDLKNYTEVPGAQR